MSAHTKSWIVSPVYDLGFFVLPCLLSLAIFAFYEVLVHLDVPNLMWWVFGIYVVFDSFFDTPHIFQSFSRTHKDISQYRKYRLAFTWGFLALIIFDTYIFYLGYKEVWMVFFACIGYYHIGKQNIGFLMAYRAKSGQFFKADVFFDRYLYLTIFFTTGCHYFFNSPESFLYPLQKYVPNYFFIGLSVLGLMIYLGRQLYLKLYLQSDISVAKVSLYFVTLLTNLIIHIDPTVPLSLIVVMETIYHDVQYQGWIMHYQKKFFEAVEKRVRLKWLGYSFIYGIVMGWILYSGQSGIWAIAIEPTFLSIILFHYLSDGFIWKFSKDPQLRTLLH